MKDHIRDPDEVVKLEDPNTPKKIIKLAIIDDYFYEIYPYQDLDLKDKEYYISSSGAYIYILIKK